jgi:hypothetical protein
MEQPSPRQPRRASPASAAVGQQLIELDNFRSNHSNMTAPGPGDFIMLLAIFFIVTIGFMLFGSCAFAERSFVS